MSDENDENRVENQVAMENFYICRPFDYYVDILENHFLRSPPQPFVCIRANSVSNTPVYINLLSWSSWKESDEIPDGINVLYPYRGGVIVYPKRSNTSALVFAVFANTNILKNIPFFSTDPVVRTTAIRSVCQFIEKKFETPISVGEEEILTENIIWGELKDIWKKLKIELISEMSKEYTQQLRLLFATSPSSPLSISSYSPSPAPTV